MPKKLYAATIILVITIGLYIFLNISYLKADNTKNISHKSPKPAPSENINFLFSPNIINTVSGQPAYLNIIAEGNLTGMSSEIIQLELSFDPTIIYNLKITPGTYLENPQILYERIDFKNGRISYALKGTNQNRGDNIVSLTFNTINYGLEKQTKIEFQPKTLIKVDSKNINFSKTDGATILIRSSSFQYAPSVSSSAKLK